ncbi:MAG TPA: septation protein SepH, partial [Nocardioides sp.]|nr:septation protein SepH [Nocardioides sp.]
MSAPHGAPSERHTPPPVVARPQPSAGGFLTLIGVTPDGRRLRLADPHDPGGREFTVEIDARLRAALGVRPSTRPEEPVPTVETQMDSMLRPRDIQARIRAGETPEAVAAAARTTVEKVMPYAAPVLAEREHVAERAQRSSIRRPAGEAP